MLGGGGGGVADFELAREDFELSMEPAVDLAREPLGSPEPSTLSFEILEELGSDGS